jgi:autotransporter-associated beta strand protein
LISLWPGVDQTTSQTQRKRVMSALTQGVSDRALRFEPLEQRRLLSVNVTTARYDLARDAANTSETVLTPSNVNTSTFGKVASVTVDAQVYAQPLIMNGIAVPGQGTHNLLLVATENDTVYAFDAQGNDPAQGYLWKTSLLNLDVSNTGETAVPESDYGTTDITPILGITGTPVIDPSTNTMYVVGLFKETNATYVQRLYALDITSGAVKLGGPVVISATIAGTGTGSSGGQLAFSAFRENQRPALTLANGEVYIGWSSHGDQNPWHGWVMAYNAATLHQDYVSCQTPNGDAGGVWMSGGGIAVDSSGNLYLTTGNGTFDVNTGGSDYGMTLEKLSPSLVPEDYFAPYNEASLSGADLDYGCSDVILMPTQSSGPANEILSEGKWGTIYLNNSNTGSLGEFTTNGPNKDLGEASITGNLNNTNSDVHNTDAYWNGYVYSGGDALPIEAFAAGNGTLGTTPSSESSHVFGSGSVEDGQGAGLSVSSNGTGNGILWALDNSGFNSNPAVLYAYSATNLNTLLWTSSQAAGGRDTAANAVKFQAPVVANGYVYVAGAGSVTIYGLLPTITAAAAANPSPVTGTTTNLSVSATDSGSDLPPTYTWAASSTPSGATLPTYSANGTAASNNTTATFYKAGTYTFTCTITDPTTGASTTSSVNVAVNPTLTSGLGSIVPSTVTVVNGGSLQFVGGGTDQFGNPMAAPANWVVNSGGVGGTVDSNGFYTAPASGTGSATVTATSGTQSASATVTVVAPAAPIVQVSLSGYFNRDGIVPDGASFSGGGLDAGGNALSGNLLGTNVVFSGNSFTIAPASTTVNNVVYGSGQAISLPQSNYAQLEILADHTNGNVTNRTLIVTYTDNSTQTLTQSFSDWVDGTNNNYANEAIAATMAYRDTSNGGTNAQTFYVHGYIFALNTSKTIKSLTLPSDTNLEILAIDLVPTGPAPGVAITTPAAANPAAAGTSTALSVGAVDASGDAAPTYSWATTLMPAGAAAPTFSTNNSTSANVTTASIAQAGTYGFTVTATDPTSGASVLSSAKVVANFGLFTTSVDIGSPSPTGSLSYNSTGSVYTTTAGGSDIGGTSDQFHFTYEGFGGNGQITAHVSSLSNSNASAKAGPMFRDSSAANGAFAAMFVTPSSGVVFEWRSADGGTAATATVASLTTPVWLRLGEAGSQFSGYYSTNGTSWTQVGTTQNVTIGVSDLAGLAVTSDSSGTATTAVIDSVSAIAAPTVATAASANPFTVTSTSTNLSVLGADPTGESNLTYTWATTGTPPAPVVYSANGTNAAKNTTATFTKAGSYNFMVTITNAGGLSITSTVGVTVQLTATTTSVSPNTAAMVPNGTQQFSATSYDQFGVAMSPQPTFSWASTVGSITSAGMLTAQGSNGSGTVTATGGGVSGISTVTVTDPAPTVTTPPAASPSTVTAETTVLSVLGADDEGQSTLTYTWATTGTPPAAVMFSTNGTNLAQNTTATFAAAGTYNFTVTITNTSNLSVSRSLAVTVQQTLTAIIVSPNPAAMVPNDTQQFSAAANDQFGAAMSPQPTFSWASTVGSITSGGMLTAQGSNGSGTVTAAANGISGMSSVTVTDPAPTVATPAAASPSTVTAETTALSVLGADDEGESTLTYTWATTGTPPAPVVFSANGTNLAQNTTATFAAAGTYNFTVTITNTSGLTYASSTTVTVNQTYSGLSISPAAPNLSGGATQQFTATALDQFGQALASQPAITWTLVSGPGTLSDEGLYMPPYASGSAVVQASSGNFSPTATVTFSSEALWNASSAGTPGSSWTTSGNWIDASTSAALSAPGVRGLTGDTVLFTSPLVAQLDGAAPALAGVTFNNAATGYGIVQGSGGSLTLQGGNGAAVSVLAGSPTIDAPVHLASNTIFNAAASTRLTMMGPIDGSGSLTMTGNGKLVLNSANTFSGGLVVQSGTVIVNAANGLGTGGMLVVGSGAASLFGPASGSTAAPAALQSAVSAATSSASTKQSPQPATHEWLPQCPVAAVMAAWPPTPPAPRLVLHPAIFPSGPFPNTSQLLKDTWWRQ